MRDHLHKMHNYGAASLDTALRDYAWALGWGKSEPSLANGGSLVGWSSRILTHMHVICNTYEHSSYTSQSCKFLPLLYFPLHLYRSHPAIKSSRVPCDIGYPIYSAPAAVFQPYCTPPSISGDMSLNPALLSHEGSSFSNTLHGNDQGRSLRRCLGSFAIVTNTVPFPIQLLPHIHPLF
jgi:hypothetical protein